MAEDERISLGPEEAVALWSKGRHVWNKWVEENPKADVDFSHIDLGQYRDQFDSQFIAFPFDGFHFPDGYINFFKAEFGAGDVSYEGAIFNGGQISFFGATFSNGSVNFRRAIFGSGATSFQNATFQGGRIDFSCARFGDEAIDFSYVTFVDCDVSFSHATFGTGVLHFDNALISSGNFNFDFVTKTDGSVYFSNTYFGTGNKIFKQTEFGKGEVDFGETKFVGGKADFKQVKFGPGNVCFDSAAFTRSGLNFADAEFKDGTFSFTNLAFCSPLPSPKPVLVATQSSLEMMTAMTISDVIFDGADFKNGKIHVGETQFTDAELSFLNGKFSNCYISLSLLIFENSTLVLTNTTFTRSRIDSNRVSFTRGNLICDNSDFLDTPVQFLSMELGIGKYTFERSRFDRGLILADLRSCGKADAISVRYSSFDGPLVFEFDEPLSFAIDLVSTHIKHPLQLSALKCVFPTMLNSSGYRQAKDKGDAERLRRLKELAEQNRDFEKAVDFRVEEMRAARWHGKHGWAAILVEGLFWLGSDYGRSLFNPIIGLIYTWFIGAVTYAKVSQMPFTYHEIIKAMPFSWGQMFVYIPSSKEARTQGLMPLFGEHMPNWLYFITFSQSLLTLVLLFQVGLVLRNRFKL